MEDTNQDALPSARVRRYFLFVHYNVFRDERISERRRLTLADSFYDRLRKDLQYLVDIVGRSSDERGCEWEGRAFVFIDVGWTHLLKTESITAARTLAIDLQRIHNEIIERLCLTECRRDTCRERRDQRVAPWPVPIQIITAADLIELLTIIDELEERQSPAEHRKLSRYLVGDVDTLRYDASKAIEGMIRIASVGRNIPILRFDDDVIFYGQRVHDMCWKAPNKEGEREKLKTWEEFKDEGSLLTEMEEVLNEGQQALRRWRDERIDATRKSILRLCARYDRACANPRLHYFVFSGHYKSQGEEDLQGELDLNDLLNGYATRVVQLAKLPKNADDAHHAEERAKMHEGAADQFLRELPQIGANPDRQVISGAGLCLSDSAILDLPPYSNMRMNVMWIDDHLKYALHDELEHFDIHILDVGAAREVHARFPQLRHAALPKYKDVTWHLNQYMQRLLLGCIADAWLRKTSDMKTRILPDVEPPFLPDDFVRARESRRDERPYVYAKAFLNAVPAGASASDAWNLHRTLWEAGVSRLQEICELWGQDVYNDTFLGLFLKGSDHDRADDFRDYIHKHYKKGLKCAVDEMENSESPYDNEVYEDKTPEQCLQIESQCLSELKLDDMSLSNSLRVLIDDFIDYFETVGFWSRYVRAVRFLVNRSGQNRELQWLFPPDESYGESTRIEPIVHTLEQLMDLRLDQEDFEALVCDGQVPQVPTPPVKDWCQLGQYTNNQHPQVTVNASAIKSYAKQKKYRADALWLIVRCYHFAHAIVIRGHGHGTVAQDGVEYEDSNKFALKYMYFFLEKEGKRDAVNLLHDLEHNNDDLFAGGKSLEDRIRDTNEELYIMKRSW